MIYTRGIYHRAIGAPRMAEQPRAKIFKHGRSQAVRLPKEFRLPGKEVRVRRVDNAVVLEPLEPFDLAAWWAKLDEYGAEFLPEGRPEQPPMPADNFRLEKKPK
jgi:antitoxin VapB